MALQSLVACTIPHTRTLRYSVANLASAENPFSRYILSSIVLSSSTYTLAQLQWHNISSTSLQAIVPAPWPILAPTVCVVDSSFSVFEPLVSRRVDACVSFLLLVHSSHPFLSSILIHSSHKAGPSSAEDEEDPVDIAFQHT